MQAGELVVGAGNEAQAAAWDGDEGEQWSADAAYYDAATRHHHAALMEAAAIGTGERVLDIGCGNGETTRAAARAASTGSALGVDLSSAMIRRARELAAAERLANATFVQADAQVHAFEHAGFDVAISRFGAMFFGDQVAAFTNIARALRPGARLAMVSWAEPARNEWLSSFADALTLGRPRPTPPPDAPGPFRHADPAVTASILEAAGFVDGDVRAIEAPMYFGTDVDDGYRAISTGLGWMMDGLEEAERPRALEALRTSLEEHLTPDGPAYASTALVITARRGK